MNTNPKNDGAHAADERLDEVRRTAPPSGGRVKSKKREDAEHLAKLKKCQKMFEKRLSKLKGYRLGRATMMMRVMEEMVKRCDDYVDVLGLFSVMLKIRIIEGRGKTK